VQPLDASPVSLATRVLLRRYRRAQTDTGDDDEDDDADERASNER
jgi:hypothetical protein